jgi:hypothetical protein
MTYFSLRKRDPEPEPEEVEGEPEEETEGEPGEEQPADGRGPILTGLLGPGAWLAARFGVGTAWGVHVVAAWAIGFYGGWAAVGIILVWVVAVLLFVPKEYLDWLTTWIERRDPGYAPDEGELEPDEETPADPRHALARWLLTTINGRPGIHLRELYPAMRNLPGQEGRTDAELRALLKGFGVRVSRSVRIGRVAGRSGVYRHHVEALLPASGESRVDPGGDAGQGAVSPPLSGVGEGV